NAAGIAVKQVLTIADEEQDILDAIDDSLSRCDVVLMTGGLGPTKDDITKYTLCKYFDTHLTLDHETLHRIEGFAEQRGMTLLEVHKMQAMVPEVCTVLPNLKGTACGMWFNKEGKVLVSMPGVPYEMRGLMTDQVIPKLKEQFPTQSIVHRTLLTIGRGESRIAAQIERLEEEMSQKEIKVAYLPSAGMVKIRLTASGSQARVNVDTYFEMIKDELKDITYGEGTDTLEKVVGELLLSRKAMLATAESCTGGFISQLMTKHSGSSSFFSGGIVAYANEVKVDSLGVQKENIKKHGAVSEAVVIEMAQGALNALHADYAVSTSGVAGPTGGSKFKPVGTVWIAVASEKGALAKQFKFGNSRARNIQLTAYSALNFLRESILQGKV
ncbi:MAG: CinA family nicotinamide mononucleotide deamidase-related protein, partial [Flavobacteriales bacterium]